MSVESPYRQGGRNLAEFSTSTGWAFYGHLNRSSMLEAQSVDELFGDYVLTEDAAD